MCVRKGFRTENQKAKAVLCVHRIGWRSPTELKRNG
jgi:hypothetical protein